MFQPNSERATSSHRHLAIPMLANKFMDRTALEDQGMNADTRFVYFGLGGLIAILVALALVNAL